jgi:hypothetical protein
MHTRQTLSVSILSVLGLCSCQLQYPAGSSPYSEPALGRGWPTRVWCRVSIIPALQYLSHLASRIGSVSFTGYLLLQTSLPPSNCSGNYNSTTKTTIYSCLRTITGMDTEPLLLQVLDCRLLITLGTLMGLTLTTNIIMTMFM